ncbi:hypothetical protein K4L44_08750 [Halosquirtibacter laminarini]|uniref:Uncharacterized protein n=1 Tax=Halosquirtibacter laminarini TaxID=3374600 RepID=A0AC61NQ60_9BACT|nr:hypothetical protein K4L44_08750 [Prolixibacteraceae bacterium]
MNLLDRIVNNRQSLFGVSGVKMIRYADDFVLMGKIITTEVKDQLHHLLTRMDLIINIEKTKHIDSKEASFKFLGFTFRNDKDLYGRDLRYINIVPNSDSEKKLRGKISDYLKRHGHKNPTELVRGLNSLVRGWINYYEIRGVTNTSLSKRKLRYYLSQKLFRYYRRKSQRKCRHYGPNAFETLVRYYGLIDPTEYHP